MYTLDGKQLEAVHFILYYSGKTFLEKKCHNEALVKNHEKQTIHDY